MGLLASCFVLLLAPQEPAPTAPPAETAAAPSTENCPAALAELEKAGEAADPVELARLAACSDANVAARAAWLLAHSKNKATLALLQGVVADSPHAEARTHAMQAVARFQDVGSTACAIAALRDSDRRVRTFAAQLLGKLKRPTGVDPLLALLEESRTSTAKGPATDLQAALLSLHDLGASEHLLRVATALHDSKVEGTGEALAFCCQDMSPKLPKTEQIPFLLGILSHREPLVRRYAIGRLAELEDPATAAALEGRLATETNELRPLVELALAQVRKQKLAPPSDELVRANQNLHALVTTLRTRWQGLDTMQQALAGSVPVVVLLLLVAALRGRRSRAQARVDAATMALVQPSEEFAEQAAAEAEQLAAEAEATTDDEPEQASEAWQDDVATHR